MNLRGVFAAPLFYAMMRRVTMMIFFFFVSFSLVGVCFFFLRPIKF